MDAPQEDRRRRAVVSGGGTGIGRAVARALLGDGYDVVLLGRRADVLEAAAAGLSEELRSGPAATPHGPTQVAADGAGAVTALPCDSGDPADVTRCAGELARTWPVLDVVVAGAGAPARRLPDGAPLEQVAAVWTEALRANLLSAVLLTTALEPRLARPGGRVVLVGSRAAATGGSTPAYVAAKAALEGWVLALAARLGPDGVTANVVAPGYTAGTELLAGRLTPERHTSLVQRIAAGRAASPDEVAAAVRFLASPAASYVNGQVLGVDGGAVP